MNLHHLEVFCAVVRRESFSGAAEQLYMTQPAVSMQVGRASVETLYAGPQGQFAGLDQVNVRLPQSLAGSGEIDVRMSVDGKRANVVRVNVK